MIVLDSTSFVFLVFPLVLHEVFGEWHLDAGGTSRIFLGLGRFLRIRALRQTFRLQHMKRSFFFLDNLKTVS